MGIVNNNKNVMTVKYFYNNIFKPSNLPNILMNMIRHFIIEMTIKF